MQHMRNTVRGFIYRTIGKWLLSVRPVRTPLEIRTVSVRFWKEADVVWFKVLSGSAWRGSVQFLNRSSRQKLKRLCVPTKMLGSFLSSLCSFTFLCLPILWL